MHEDLLGAVALMAVLSICFHAVTRILTWRRGATGSISVSPSALAC
jgi:hypothetical protein